MQIRPATAEDCEALLHIRNHYVTSSFAVFDEEPLVAETVARWIASFSVSGPYRLLVATDGGRVHGFASSQRYRDHPAFRQTVETSIYTAPGESGLGVGTALYASLFPTLAAENLHCAVVGIALPNEASVKLHKKFGFTEVGVFTEYAVKRGQYISSVWLQRQLVPSAA
ncbi:N-acetyltransferase family protein [Paucibacter sp. DJ1R-11]|uniref:GNAT family N-acetyltransferase n=1 Tax=Paucibacter sp. DJ1R-11 TaxID=2893556 RepID=UPI0021E4FB06|nr:GNAT family N-acetyltransferase [Paucibacter sp. DJ1R-11]MCV2366431.1 N-acetyltransferase family protein [Paucibacter sp. DJ1R-11]